MRLLDLAPGWTARRTWRTAHIDHCRTCHATVLIGLNADTCAHTVTCDPTPLTTHQEALAWLAGRTCTTLRVQDRRPILMRRTTSHIRKPNAPGDCLPNHQCHQPLPETSTRLTPPPALPGLTTHTDNRCPF